MFIYLAQLYESLQHNTIKYIHGYSLTMVTCTEWTQLGLHSLDNNCW